MRSSARWRRSTDEVWGFKVALEGESQGLGLMHAHAHQGIRVPSPQ
jgi:hypothetical protein